MTISDITVNDLIEYLRIDDATDADKTMLEAIYVNARAFISSYTGIPYTASVVEAESSSDDDDIAVTTSTVTKTDSAGNVTTIVIDSDGTETTTYVDKDGNALDSAPENLDDYEDLWLPCMILCQDAFDNRTLYPDKSNLNRAVETALGMHVTAKTLLGG